MDRTLLELALAVSAKPVSVDALVDWGLARPSELLGWLDEARGRGILTEDGTGSGTVQLTDTARALALAAGSSAQFATLARHAALVPELLETARRGVDSRGGRVAGEIYAGAFGSLPPEDFPGGPGAYVAAVVNSIRLYRGAYRVLGPVLDRAIEVAIARGDLGSQALLRGARALATIRGPQRAQAVAELSAAREAAEAVGGKVRVELLTYTAVSMVFAGRFREAITAFEELLGDVPADLLDPENQPLFDPESVTPGAALGILAIAYSSHGDHPRAVELLERLRALGERIGRPVVTNEARVLLALLHGNRGLLEAAEAHTAAVFEHYGSADAEPLYAYFAGISHAWVCAERGELAAARAAFEAGMIGWRRAASPPLAGLLPYLVFQHLEAAGLPPLECVDIVAEAQRSASIPIPHAAGLGRWFLAMRRARTSPDAATLAEVARELDAALALLDEAGALAELSRVLVDAVAIAEQRGLPAEAARLRERGARLQIRLPVQAAAPAGAEAARLRSLVLGLGRLPLSGRREGLWGELAARLCQGLGAERCALVALDEPPRLFAARGGGKDWQDAVLAQARAGAPEQASLAVESSGRQRMVVPFAAAELNRRALLVLESGLTPLAVPAGDGELLDALGVQLGILLGNVTLWQELAAARERLEQENRYFRQSRPVADSGSRLVAHSPPMRQVLELIARAAPSNVAVLIHGETGVGKELVAHEVHQQSARRDGPFIAVHIASLAPGLVSSGLFGHERGAFTGATEQAKGRFELADGGTLFLDEVGELSLEDQVKLLRVLQEGTFERVGGTRRLRSDFRVVAATNRDLEAQVRAGRFREDLYFRLATFPIRVPPLRERREEIPTLALYFMERVGRQRGVRFEGIGEADMERLRQWQWPGNVRELEHVIERAALLSEPPRLRIPPLENGLARAPAAASEAAPAEWVSLAEAERRYIRQVLRHTQGRITGGGGAAELLALKPSTLNFRIQKLGLTGDLRAARGR